VKWFEKELVDLFGSSRSLRGDGPLGASALRQTDGNFALAEALCASKSQQAALELAQEATLAKLDASRSHVAKLERRLADFRDTVDQATTARLASSSDPRQRAVERPRPPAAGSEMSPVQVGVEAEALRVLAVEQRCVELERRAAAAEAELAAMADLRAMDDLDREATRGQVGGDLRRPTNQSPLEGGSLAFLLTSFSRRPES
jgi:hypothetical protein